MPNNTTSAAPKYDVKIHSIRPEGSEFHYCDRFGFQQISFGEPEQTQTMGMSM